MAMTRQSVVKHFLTEGDKFLVSRLSPLEDQGGYAIASNYGTLNRFVILIIASTLYLLSCLFSSESGFLLTWITRLVGGAYHLPANRGDLKALLLQITIFIIRESNETEG